MLTKLDDYPIHQTPEPIAHTYTADRNFYDRYFFNGYTRDGSLFFAVGFGLYPNRSVMDAAVSVVRGGTQYVVRASRRAPLERTETDVAPIHIAVVDPMRTLRITVDPNEYGIEGEFTFHARTAALEEPRFTQRVGTRATFDVTRFAQFGSWEGSLTVDGETIELRPEEVLGSRDRSWGVRGVGEPDGGAPPAPAGAGGGGRQFYWLWAPINYDDGATHFGVNEDALGHAWHSNGVFAPLLDAGEPERMARASATVAWESGTRRAASCDVTFERAEGGEHRIHLEPLLTFQMSGIGYGHPVWGHGRWVGEREVTGESFKPADLAPLDPGNIHIQALVRAMRTDPDGSTHEGIGVLEQLVIGPHAPSGFTQALDGAS